MPTRSTLSNYKNLPQFKLQLPEPETARIPVMTMWQWLRNNIQELRTEKFYCESKALFFLVSTLPEEKELKAGYYQLDSEWVMLRDRLLIMAHSVKSDNSIDEVFILQELPENLPTAKTEAGSSSGATRVGNAPPTHSISITEFNTKVAILK